MKDDLLTVDQAAEAIGVSKSTLQRWRTYGGGPPFVKFGAHVYYKRASVKAWFDSQLVEVNSTSELGAPA